MVWPAWSDTPTALRRRRSMSTQTPTQNEGTDPRPRYVLIGTDSRGAHHCYRTADETILVIEGNRVIERLDIDGRSVDGYVRFVRDEVDGRNWVDRNYLLPGEFSAGVADRLQEAM